MCKKRQKLFQSNEVLYIYWSVIIFGHQILFSQFFIHNCIIVNFSNSIQSLNNKIDVPQYAKTYLLTYASNEDSNQSALLRSLTRVFVVRMTEVCILGYPNTPSEDSDQPARTRRLIRIFAWRGRICLKVRFLTLRLKYSVFSLTGYSAG